MMVMALAGRKEEDEEEDINNTTTNNEIEHMKSTELLQARDTHYQE